MTFLLGIVGTPASGKSTVASHLKSKGARWINADLIAREVLLQDDVIEQLTCHFGSEIIDAQGAIDRASLARRVFGETPEQVAALGFLESVVHPITRQRIVAQIKTAAGERVDVAILDIPLLFESGWDRSCDAIWCLDAPRKTREIWAASRGWTADELDRRESAQRSIAEKRRLSNRILVNDATLPNLCKLVDDLWAEIATIRSVAWASPDAGHCFSD